MEEADREEYNILGAISASWWDDEWYPPRSLWTLNKWFHSFCKKPCA